MEISSTLLHRRVSSSNLVRLQVCVHQRHVYVNFSSQSPAFPAEPILKFSGRSVSKCSKWADKIQISSCSLLTWPSRKLSCCPRCFMLPSHLPSQCMSFDTYEEGARARAVISTFPIYSATRCPYGQFREWNLCEILNFQWPLRGHYEDRHAALSDAWS